MAKDLARIWKVKDEEDVLAIKVEELVSEEEKVERRGREVVWVEVTCTDVNRTVLSVKVSTEEDYNEIFLVFLSFLLTLPSKFFPNLENKSSIFFFVAFLFKPERKPRSEHSSRLRNSSTFALSSTTANG